MPLPWWWLTCALVPSLKLNSHNLSVLAASWSSVVWASQTSKIIWRWTFGNALITLDNCPHCPHYALGEAYSQRWAHDPMLVSMRAAISRPAINRGFAEWLPEFSVILFSLELPNMLNSNLVILVKSLHWAATAAPEAATAVAATPDPQHRSRSRRQISLCDVWTRSSCYNRNVKKHWVKTQIHGILHCFSRMS